MRSALLKSQYYNTPARTSFGSRRHIIREHRVVHNFFPYNFVFPDDGAVWPDIRGSWCVVINRLLKLSAFVVSYCNNRKVVQRMDNVELKTRCMECIK